MIWFFCEQNDGRYADFGEAEASHCLQVLRHKVGDRITWTDGRGGLFHGDIVSAGKKSLTAAIAEHIPDYQVRGYRFELAVAPPKSGDRVEWMMEKCTEFGLDACAPLWCARSERARLRTDRLQGVALAAMKQSKQALLPQIAEPETFKNWLKVAAAQPDTQKFIAWCSDTPQPHLMDIIEKGRSVTVLIGPEGDFTPEEVEAAISAGFQPVSLGATRLRTETAAVAAAHIAALVNR